MKIGLFNNSSQPIGTKGLRFSKFDGDHPGVVIRWFHEIRVKPCP